MTDTNQAGDRRQSPRVPPAFECECRVPVRIRVRLLDISLDGALLAGDAHLPKGTITQVRLPLGPSPFSAAGEVRRVSEDRLGARAAATVAVAFRSMDEHSRRSLQDFVRRART
jgi:hypothetical protein